MATLLPASRSSTKVEESMGDELLDESSGDGKNEDEGLECQPDRPSEDEGLEHQPDGPGCGLDLSMISAVTPSHFATNC